MQPGAPQPWVPQQPWPAQPVKKSNRWNWAFGAMALVAVIAVTAVVTVLVQRPNSSGNGGNSAGRNNAPSQIASANDKGPVTVITQDPTCDKWMPINSAVAAQENNGWDKQDPSVPASEWTSDVRAQYDGVAAALKNAADQTVELAKQTPHRVMRELYEQYIAYSRAYAEKIPAYTVADKPLAGVSTSIGSALTSACMAITYGSARNRASLVAPPTYAVGDRVGG
jgi:hypothetical protein